MKKHITPISILIVSLILVSALVFTIQQNASAAITAMPDPIIEFPGIDRTETISDTDTLIPDTTGAAGFSHYMQAVNKSIAIFRKDGGPPLGNGTPIDMTTFDNFWTAAATGTACDGNDGSTPNHHGQPYLIFDHLFGRWVVVDVAYDESVPIDTPRPYYLCIAVSNSLDAPMTPGTEGNYFNSSFWYFYAVETYQANQKYYPNMPKLGLWPDGYYLSVDLHDPDEFGKYDTLRGTKVYAFNRTDLTSGAYNNVGGFQYKDFYLPESSSFEHLVPSNLLGYVNGFDKPNYFAAINPGKLYIWEFDVDWSDPDNSTFGTITHEPNYTFNTDFPDYPVEYSIPQRGTDLEIVESHGDRLMSPLQYRVLDGIASLWATHTVVSNGRTGLRWYEFQFFDGESPDFAQKGVYTPDTAYRWLGSLATDITGNMAIGFSYSKPSGSGTDYYPSIKYAGRLRNDPYNELTQGETFLYQGSGSQDDGNPADDYGPWGRQSQMSVDPLDECVFWYTNMYYEKTGMDWNTRIGWFSFPECRGGDSKLISLHTNGTQGNDHSGLDKDVYEMYQVAMSADGRYVAFTSEAETLVDDDDNGYRDVFLRDRDTDNDGIFDEPLSVSTTRISMGYNGSQANGDSWEVSISYNGRLIAYSSDASNLVTGDNLGARDIFLYDRITGHTTIVSVADYSSTDEGNNASSHPFISGDGSAIAFRSLATNLVTGDTNNAADIFVREPANSRTFRVNLSSTGDQADPNSDSYNPTLSETGEFVAFGSTAENLATDGNGFRDVFVHDRVLGTTRLVSIATSGAQGLEDSYTPFISGNGNYVVFASEADNLDEVISDTNNSADIFVHDLVITETTRVSINFFGVEGNDDSYTPSISRDGRYIAFASKADNLDVTINDPNSYRDIFLHDRSLVMDGIYDFGLTSRVTRDAVFGGEPNGESYAPVVAAYGRHVAYVSEAEDLDPQDHNNHWDVFAHDNERVLPIFLSIPSNLPASTGATVSVPVLFSGNSASIDTTTFSIDFDETCLSFNGTDSDSDGIPDAITFSVAGDFVTSATYNGGDKDGEIDVAIHDQVAPRTPIADGTIMTIDLKVKSTCSAPPGSSRSARVGFSHDPSASFGTYGISVQGLALDGFVRVLEGLLGDCNGDGKVNAGDLSALVLEIFDGDDVLPINTPGGSFPGNPVGCNSNQDYLVDAGDLSCTVMIIFGNPSCTGLTATSSSSFWIEMNASTEQ
jgi:hypothetical protein